MTPGLDRRRFLTGAALLLPATAFGKERRDMQIELTFQNQAMTATLHDNPSVRDLLTLLPLVLTLEDYGQTEKIAYLPRKLSEEASGPFGDEAAGDVCYYAPWGNLALFHGSYRYSSGLIRLGRFDDEFEPLLLKGKFPGRIERLG